MQGTLELSPRMKSSLGKNAREDCVRNRGVAFRDRTEPGRSEE